jgi:hypothetical protein
LVTRPHRVSRCSVEGDFVEHPEFESGVVMTTSGGRLLVLFRSHGYRMPATDLVVDNDLLVASAGA